MKGYNFPIWRGKPLQKLTRGLLKINGRNNLGRITVRSRGGGHKRRARIVDFARTLQDIPAQIVRIERDPTRTAPLALLHYQNGIFSYILAPKNVGKQQSIISSKLAAIKPGNCLPLKNIPIGTHVHNVEPRQGLGVV
jgi:large subunit ribosomal protein L2